jgi:two-component system cell cycle response regulator CtrA
MRVLVATDPDAVYGALTLRLSGDCIPFDIADVDEVAEFLRSYDYDIVLLAVRDPAKQVARLRRARIVVPVLVMTAGVGAARAALLDLGADDAISPDCEAAELAARLRAIVRRSRGHASRELRAGAAELRLGRMEVVVHGRPVALTPKEYGILELLFLRRGVVHSKPAIVNQVYGAEDGPALRTLDVIVCKLRKKLAAYGAPDLVATVWGSGLMLHELPEIPLAPAMSEPMLVAV